MQRMKEYSIAREFFVVGLVGAVTSVLVSASRPEAVQLWHHVLGGALLMGAMAVVIRSPPGGCLTVIMAFLVTLVIGGTDPHAAHRLSWWEYVPFLVALQYWVWGIFELIRHTYRMNKHPEYRERFNDWQSRNKGGNED